MRHPHKKKKSRNKAGRKDRIFGEIVRRATQDSMITQEEIENYVRENNPVEEGEKPAELEKDERGRVVVTGLELPEGTVPVDTLQGHFAFQETRLARHKETIELVLKEFSDEFWEENGRSVLDLRRDRKGRVWADDQTMLHLSYIAIAMKLARWTYTRKEWAALPHGLPYIQFICAKRNEIKTNGETNEQEKPITTENVVPFKPSGGDTGNATAHH